MNEYAYRTGNLEDFPHLKERTEEEILEDIMTDDVLWQTEWEWLTDQLTELMHKANYRYYWKDKWYVEVSNFGWRNLDGYKWHKAADGEELLKVLPKCEKTFKIYYTPGSMEIRITCSHHDSPILGKEWYHVRPAYTNEVEEHYYHFK